MAEPLGKRGRCRSCTRCGGFISAVLNAQGYPNSIPQRVSETCAACSDPWISHSALTPAVDGKGGCQASSCGGFILPPGSQWSVTVSCVCGQPWSNHDLVASPEPRLPFASSETPAPPPLTSQLQPLLPNPISVFARPPSFGSTSVPASAPTPSATAVANTNRQGAIACHFKPKYKAPRAFPGSTAAESTFEVLVAFWPNILPDSPNNDEGSPALDFKYTLDEFTQLVLVLKAHGLAFVATLPSQTGIVTSLNSQLDAHFSANRIDLPTAPQAADSDDVDALPWFLLPWMLLEPTKRKATFTFDQSSRVNANNFSKKFIFDMNTKFNNPDSEHSDKPLIVLGPRWGHVKAPLPTTLSTAALDDAFGPEQPHPCFGRRLLYEVTRRHDVMCHDDCPQAPRMPIASSFRLPRPPRQRTPEAMVASTSQIRSRSPDSPSPPRTRRRTGSSPYIEEISDDDEFPLSVLLPNRERNPSRTARPAVLPSQTVEVRLATGTEIQEWQRSISVDVLRMPQSREVNIDGATIAAIAEFVLSTFVYCYHQSKFTTDALRSPFPSHPDIRNPQRMNFLSFLQHQAQRSYRVGPPRGAAITGSSIGRGVERSVFRTILENVAADGHCWVPSSMEPGYVTFQISPLADSDRRAKLYAYGRITALHLYYYGHGYQIGLWPVLAAVLGRKSMLLGEQFLRLVSPNVAAEFGPWFALHPGDPLPSSLSHPVSSLFMSLLNVQLSTLPSTFTESQYEDFTVRLLTARIFGDPTPWSSDDVREFQSGMRMPLQITAGRNFCDYFDDSPPLKTACLIAGMYCRQIQSANDVLSHLRFQCAAMAPPPQVKQMRQLFELRFKRYLTGVGHPPYFHDQGLVSTQEENSTAHTAPFFRLQLLLVAALESSSLPVNDNWSIRLSVSSTLSTNSAAENPEPLHFHTCTGGVDVRINAKFLDLLIKSPQGEAASEFDNWVHAQLYRADSTYNRI
ncbi:hypothetical protein R3P38DRAFT_3611992 [Favolaschia claudopus]|uniref:Uncharacterized protein n=1 Tax=Favolaschia claudopus TaxID=2862362 RepID=A0AAW0A6E9_9AGAR